MDTKSLINKSMRRSRSLPFTAFLLILAAGLLISQSRDNDGANKKTDVALLNKIVTLTQQLEIESLRGVEYFNSSAYDSLVKSSQNSDPAERLSADRLKAKRLEARIREPNRKYFLTLLALREIYQDSLYSQMDTANNVYAQIDTTLKTGVIIDALNQAKYFLLN